MSKPGSIFISYRRSDSIAEAGRIYDRLVEAFGSERIFKDVDNIPYGADFVEYLDQAVAQCEVLIPLIGRTWLTVTDDQGNRRLDDPRDFVRVEIASALKRDILILPVLVNGAEMPEPADLPDDLKSLARRNAAQVRHDPDFNNDMRRLIAKLRERFNRLQPDAIGTTTDLEVEPIPSPAAIAPSSQDSSDNPLLVPVVLSVAGGILALVEGILHADVGLIAGPILILAAVVLLTHTLWAWVGAIAGQVAAVILCLHTAASRTFRIIRRPPPRPDGAPPPAPEGSFSLPGLGNPPPPASGEPPPGWQFHDLFTISVLVLVAVLASIAIVLLLQPKVRRRFR